MRQTLHLATVRERLRNDLEAELLRIAIAGYRHRAQIAQDFSRIAARQQRRGLAQGLLEAAATYQAMAEGLKDQQTHTYPENCNV